MNVASIPARRFLLAVAVLGVAVGTIALTPPEADARYTVIVRDGFYGRVGDGGTSLMFRVRNRRVYDLKFVFLITCNNSDTGEQYERYFDASRNVPQGRRVPRDGVFNVSWSETSALRPGQISATVNFDRRVPMATINIDVPPHVGSYETCFATYEWPVRRGAGR